MAQITENPTWMQLSADIKKLNLRFPIAELSDNLGYTRANVSVFVNGKKMPSKKFLQKFYELYGEAVEKAEEEIERKRKESHKDEPPFCANCYAKDKEIAFLKGKIEVLEALLGDGKTKAISA